MTTDLDEAIRKVDAWRAAGEARSIALIANAADVEPELVRRGWHPDSSPTRPRAHDPLGGYVPGGIGLAEALELRERDPDGRTPATPWPPWPSTCGRCSPSRHRARSSSTTATTSGHFARDAGVENAFDFPGFVPAFIRPLFCEGKGPFRWAALSGDPNDILKTDAALAELFPEDASLHRWLRLAEEKVPFQGLPARICWLGYGERAQGRAADQRDGARQASCPRRS